MKIKDLISENKYNYPAWQTHFDPNAEPSQIKVGISNPSKALNIKRPKSHSGEVSGVNPLQRDKILKYVDSFPNGTIKDILLAIAKSTASQSVETAILNATKSSVRQGLRPMITQHIKNALK